MNGCAAKRYAVILKFIARFCSLSSAGKFSEAAVEFFFFSKLRFINYLFNIEIFLLDLHLSSTVVANALRVKMCVYNARLINFD